MKMLPSAALLCCLSIPASAQFAIDQSQEGLQQDAQITYLKDLAVGEKAYVDSWPRRLLCIGRKDANLFRDGEGQRKVGSQV
jgi:hypothetical protein